MAVLWTEACSDFLSVSNITYNAVLCLTDFICCCVQMFCGVACHLDSSPDLDKYNINICWPTACLAFQVQ